MLYSNNLYKQKDFFIYIAAVRQSADSAVKYSLDWCWKTLIVLCDQLHVFSLRRRQNGKPRWSSCSH